MNTVRTSIIVIALITLSSGLAGIAAGEPTTIEDNIDTSSENSNILVAVNSNEIPDWATSERKEVKKAIEQSQKPVIDHFNSPNGVTVDNTYWISNTIEITVNMSKTDIQTIADHKDITRLSANKIMSKTEPPESDSLASTETHTLGKYTYGLSQTNAPTAWEEFNVSGNGVNVTVIDTGVYNNHPDISLKGSSTNNFKGGWAVLPSEVEYRVSLCWLTSDK